MGGMLARQVGLLISRVIVCDVSSGCCCYGIDLMLLPLTVLLISYCTALLPLVVGTTYAFLRSDNFFMLVSLRLRITHFKKRGKRKQKELLGPLWNVITKKAPKLYQGE